MRSKICKAKRKDNKEWVEGYYFCMVHDDKRHEHHFIIPIGADLSKGTPIEQIQVEIDIDTLCDDTGLTDNNGRKVWENDIVKWLDKLYKVSFYDSMCSFVLVTPTGHWNHMEMNYGQKLENFDYEVVGNVFDNPELLNATEDVGHADQSGLMPAT